MLRRPNDERKAFGEQVQAGINPGKDGSGRVSIACHRMLALDTHTSARHNLKYLSIMPQPQR
jgi:hypothetical protein